MQEKLNLEVINNILPYKISSYTVTVTYELGCHLEVYNLFVQVEINKIPSVSFFGMYTINDLIALIKEHSYKKGIYLESGRNKDKGCEHIKDSLIVHEEGKFSCGVNKELGESYEKIVTTRGDTEYQAVENAIKFIFKDKYVLDF